MREQDEFIEQVLPNYQRLVRALTLTCGDPETAEDAVQEAVARAWSRSRRGDEPRSLEGWIAVVAMNEVRTGARRRASRDRAVEQLRRNADSQREDSSDRTADVIAVQGALRALAPRQREVTVLHYYLGFDIAEAAELLGISAGAARNALHHARSNLAAAFEVESTDTDVAADATSRDAGHG